jgi:hypothetical protein
LYELVAVQFVQQITDMYGRLVAPAITSYKLSRSAPSKISADPATRTLSQGRTTGTRHARHPLMFSQANPCTIGTRAGRLPMIGDRIVYVMPTFQASAAMGARTLNTRARSYQIYHISSSRRAATIRKTKFDHRQYVVHCWRCFVRGVPP